LNSTTHSESAAAAAAEVQEVPAFYPFITLIKARDATSIFGGGGRPTNQK
jgi:hypothetical protein